MKTLIPNLSYDSGKPLYQQLYSYIKKAILSGYILPGEKLPSLRGLSRELALSLTTVELAYSQLSVEGYINSKPQSGYFVNSISAADPVYGGDADDEIETPVLNPDQYSLSTLDEISSHNVYYDSSCFDFIKWKKCINKILTDFSHLLLTEGEPQGEAALRYQISKYAYQVRGVRCTPDQIVIGAGTQQITSLLCILLHKIGIDQVAVEDPGYLPVRNIFRDRGMKITPVPVKSDGIEIDRLPANIKSTVYVSPSNQFPTGYIMPIAKRYTLLDWAAKNQSIIIEDDYNSELRYFGKAVPSLQGLDTNQQVIYLGSFSSTLFPSIRISYMVLPLPMLTLFKELLSDYTQTCSKTEQLTLALYMENGFYQTNIKKLRSLYAQKIQLATNSIQKYMGSQIKILNNTSGLHMLLSLPAPWDSPERTQNLCDAAGKLGLLLVPIPNYAPDVVTFYYNQIPLSRMDEAIRLLYDLIFRPSLED